MMGIGIMQLFIILVLPFLIYGVVKHNLFVKLRNNRESTFADIDVLLKQRHDLINQLVSTVKGYASHEKETLNSVVNARNEAMYARNIDEKMVAENRLNYALTGLKVTIEAYPELKANSNFLQLQEKISDIENKLATVRMYFNSSTREYNTAIEMFPASFFAALFRFQKEKMFDLGSSERQNLHNTSTNF